MADSTDMGFLMIILSIVFVMAALSLTVSSIGVDCYNENEKMKDEKRINYEMLIGNIVVAILAILCVSSISSALVSRFRKQ